MVAPVRMPISWPFGLDTGDAVYVEDAAEGIGVGEGDQVRRRVRRVGDGHHPTVFCRCCYARPRAPQRPGTGCRQ